MMTPRALAAGVAGKTYPSRTVMLPALWGGKTSFVLGGAFVNVV